MLARPSKMNLIERHGKSKYLISNENNICRAMNCSSKLFTCFFYFVLTNLFKQYRPYVANEISFCAIQTVDSRDESRIDLSVIISTLIHEISAPFLDI
jgi:hypothetical protein